MKYALFGIMLVGLAGCGQPSNHVVHLYSGLEISITDNWERPIILAGVDDNLTIPEALAVIEEIYRSEYPNKPDIIVQSETKRMADGEDNLRKRLKLIAQNENVHVIYMPTPRGYAYRWELELSELSKTVIEESR